LNFLRVFLVSRVVESATSSGEDEVEDKTHTNVPSEAEHSPTLIEDVVEEVVDQTDEVVDNGEREKTEEEKANWMLEYAPFFESMYDKVKRKRTAAKKAAEKTQRAKKAQKAKARK